MVNSIKSVNCLTKSFLRLQLIKNKVNSNCFNNKKNSSISLPNNNRYYNCNISENNNLVLNKLNLNNYSRYGKNNAKSHMFVRGTRHSSHVKTENVKSSQKSPEANENMLIIYDSQCPLFVVNKQSSVDKPSEFNSDDVEVDDENEFLIDTTLKKYKIPAPLETCDEDFSYYAPYMQPTFNFATYANRSETIQQLVKLGVELYKIERYPNSMKSLLRRDFNEIKPYIQFLHDCGVHPHDIGHCLTKFPLIIDEDLDDLHTRIRYLRAHKFSIDDIQRIVSVCPQWLRYTTKEVDRKLGYVQAELKLSGEQVRKAFVMQPKLILAPRSQLRENFFSVKEEMGFDDYQIKQILLAKPSIFINERKFIAKTFDYVHNQMQISLELLTKIPVILLAPVSKIAERHEFLKLLKRDQYDPRKPLYVNLEDLSRSSDYEFCTNIAKTSIQLFDMFLKTR
ncbi:transcription termination factor 3, mitochondrial [Chelonus insularis]|uniref:transcription termination factor 3, mitochondrial n=1 Tax=Chelonus insularis TaxID=460826 RepID=UPI00158F2227|nr:transcription termination factor 3, mitochondrial [Chelonus insularis]XP_034944450.1 transcription termination factor 3, mitochondrial [Chelonus insularis]